VLAAAEAPAAPPPGDACTAALGEAEGRAAATRKGDSLPWVGGGLCSGFLCGCIGCLGATGAAYLLDPEIQATASCAGRRDYQAGYDKGYAAERRLVNARDAFAGGAVGVAAVFVLLLLL
jgi:hypothetical protein